MLSSAPITWPMSKLEKKDRAETTIKEMGLQDAVDTRIGGWGVKGISGGPKRRVSICIEILTRPKLLSLDEPTSGLNRAILLIILCNEQNCRIRSKRSDWKDPYCISSSTQQWSITALPQSLSPVLRQVELYILILLLQQMRKVAENFLIFLYHIFILELVQRGKIPDLSQADTS